MFNVPKAGCWATLWIFLAGMLQQVLPVGPGLMPDGDEKAFKRLPSFKKKKKILIASPRGAQLVFILHSSASGYLSSYFVMYFIKS